MSMMFISRVKEKKRRKWKKTNAIRNTQKQWKTAEFCWHLISVLYIVENENILKICLLFERKFQMHDKLTWNVFNHLNRKQNLRVHWNVIKFCLKGWRIFVIKLNSIKGLESNQLKLFTRNCQNFEENRPNWLKQIWNLNAKLFFWRKMNKFDCNIWWVCQTLN